MSTTATEMTQLRGRVAQIQRRGFESATPLSYGQEQIWLHTQLVPGLALYNEPVTIRKSGALDVEVLRRAFTEVIRRHEAWRTNFRMEGGQLFQTVQLAGPVEIPVVDLRGFPENQREAEALRVATMDALRPFNLAKGPLFRALLIHVSDDDHRLYLTLHHIIFDGTSIYHVLVPELAALYTAYSRGEASPLPELPLQFADFSAWQREWLTQSGTLEAQLAYWREQLAHLTMPPLPVDHQRPPVQSFHGAIHPFALGPDLSLEIKQLARRNGTTLFMTLLAGLATLLNRYSGSDDIAIGTVSSSRKRSEVEGLLGYFLNPLVLRNDLSGNPTFRETLKRVRNVSLDALSNDDAPFTRIVNELHPARTLSCNPLIQVLFTLEPPMPAGGNGWSAALSHSRVDTGLVKYDLCLELDDAPAGISGRFKFNTDLFDAATAARMAGHFETLLWGAVQNPDARISQLPVLTAHERKQVLADWNATEAALPGDLRIHDLFEAAAEKNPGAVAVVQDGKKATYGELNQRANALAQELRKRGIEAEQRVGICLHPSLEMLVAILGILKAGGAYVPLDPSYPRQRLQFILDDSRLKLLLTASADQSQLPALNGVDVICVDHQNEAAREGSGQYAACGGAGPDNLAYVIYTSGTTGTPRGVEITHRNLVSSTQARLDYYATTSSSRFLLLSSFAFDSSLAGIFGTLCAGGTLVLCPGPVQESLPNLGRMVARHEISDLLCVPSVYSLLLEQAERGQLATLRRAIVAGESCPAELVERHYNLLPTTTLYNEYGPSEATVWSSVFVCKPKHLRPLVPIGHPIANTKIYILDRNLNLVPPGVPGELCISGAGVARGYLNRPELTAERFVAVSFGSEPTQRLYRSGDLARHLPDGNLELLGRLDEQVKVRGFRVELEEISSVLSEYPGVRQAVAALREDQPGQPEIAAYVVPTHEGVVEKGGLRKFLRDRLPEYMVPSTITSLDRLPLSPNGKIDRTALPPPELALTEKEKALGPMEQKLAAIFATVLGRQWVGATQNFFELGGHSLLLARLIVLIEQDFGATLSWAEVFRAPTVRELAELLTGRTAPAADNAIIPIQPSGAKRPLFWVRGGPLFLALARGLGADQPLLGLDLPLSDAAQLPVPYKLEDIASALVKKMREVQPEGPYNIAGLCVNGVIAYEMALQLRRAKQEIGVLALFDAQNPEYYHNFSSESRSRVALNKVDFHLKKLLAAAPGALPGMARERFARAGQRLNVMRWRVHRHFALRVDIKHLRDLDTIIHPASYDYRPGPFAGKVLFFQSSDWPKGSYWNFYASWERLVTDLQVCRVKGGHESMFAESNVGPITEGLRDGLEPFSVQGDFPHSAIA